MGSGAGPPPRPGTAVPHPQLPRALLGNTLPPWGSSARRWSKPLPLVWVTLGALLGPRGTGDWHPAGTSGGPWAVCGGAGWPCPRAPGHLQPHGKERGEVRLAGWGAGRGHPA